MDKRFFSFFNLTEDQAIALLDTPQDQIGEEDSRYIAASHLINFPTERSIAALIRAVQQTDPVLENRIVRRKSVETLGRLQAVQALPVIRTCLSDDDCYTVENAVWAIGEIGTQDSDILEEVAQLLDKPGQTYRVIIHTLTKLDYQPAETRIRKFVDDLDPPTASAAIAAICRLTRDFSKMGQVVAMLQHKNVLGRRLSIQDLIDAHHYEAIPNIAKCPVSLVFRLRGIRMLAAAGIADKSLTFDTIQPYLEQTLRDQPGDLDLVHSYEELPELPFLINQLYETDFGRCYLATKTILEHYSEEAPAALFATFAEEGNNDYGAHFHVVKLFGWLKHSPAYDLLLEALNNPQPQFQKSRAAAAIALGELGEKRAIPELKTCLETKIWDLKYAALMALEKLGDVSGYEVAAADQDWLVQAKIDAHTSLTSEI
ncbi:MAG: HEAT repeat domain-containing protein [Oscillatoriales cyanobacterium]|uniref:HEAT repeat domain-containing protein n=1 Tax=Microcoleus sp. PH2017_05_CCC_O_A TaxID=2798816 RepID=UPI001DBF6D7E|nr:HEAT repeat domain-containing protein [Microcoleus sp. PH2017_05_CCC_O_A]TAG05047.1 MAG: HEAT repeat domain-containing protein [Oscillatoriales cyanobacterium]MCC3438307.1 HEAT repeat domain-containing protein [Microcoleus sp. PH2017_05_CCC_O_A]TAG14157.1 MAG: HEAT repeat domain-containing protein [Oscillatoriales cyanobacterium]TAG49118.1 MAG: HEAT repeat domain-containing protein [Oscillatoriales cyanobacterium]TAG58749.1 MAG: HEAT repeat domain-containing protein [Oscillatoriales cyanoba